MPKTAVDYSNTIIYKICCNDPTITETYVGHTTNFTKRKYTHKSNCNNESRKQHYHLKVYQTIRDNGGWDNWNMIEICKYPCASSLEARAEERRFYEILNASLNMELPCRYGSDIIEYRKQYRINNPDKLREEQKQWRNNNQEYIKNYQPRKLELQRIRRAKKRDALLLA
jgi:hypothetical protein